jgi:hypothetical protein
MSVVRQKKNNKTTDEKKDGKDGQVETIISAEERLLQKVTSAVSAVAIDGIIKDEQYDAIMLVQQENLDNTEVTTNLKVAQAYCQQNDVLYESGDATGGCSPLYRVLQTLPDDFDPNGPTVEYVRLLQGVAGRMSPSQEGKSNDMAGIGNASDGDKPLGLLYRRFTRQFDISEMFFAGGTLVCTTYAWISEAKALSKSPQGQFLHYSSNQRCSGRLQ